jgi:hypothetical protein
MAEDTMAPSGFSQRGAPSLPKPSGLRESSGGSTPKIEPPPSDVLDKDDSAAALRTLADMKPLFAELVQISKDSLLKQDEQLRATRAMEASVKELMRALALKAEAPVETKVEEPLVEAPLTGETEGRNDA